MTEQEDLPREYRKCRVELLHPGADWEKIWRRARLPGLGSEATSFLWKLLHQILPTEERLARILPNNSPICKHCPGETGSLEHCLFTCSLTRDSGQWLLSVLHPFDPAVTSENLCRLDFEALDDSEMPLVWVASHAMAYAWKSRMKEAMADPQMTRSYLETRISLLRETRHKHHANQISLIVSS